MKMKISRFFLMLVAAGTMTAGCDKNAVTIIAGPQEGGSNVKFFNFAVGGPSVNFYINDYKASAVSATGCAVLDDSNRQACLSTGLESTAGVAYGAAAGGGFYADVAPGQITLSGRISATTDKNLAIASLPTTVAADKFYSFYLSGIYNTTAKSSESFIVEDVLPAIDFNVAYVRFVNASSTTQPMTLWVKNRTTGDSTAVRSAVAYKSAGTFVAVPEGSYDFATRAAGSATAIFTRTQISFFRGRVYTIAARGNTATASTMLLDNTANR